MDRILRLALMQMQFYIVTYKWEIFRDSAINSERRCTHSHTLVEASRPVNRATHYHKCPSRARPTRKSVSQITRVGLCHLSPLIRPARPLCTPPRCARLVSTEQIARPDRAHSFLCPSSSRRSGRNNVSGYLHYFANNTLVFVQNSFDAPLR